MTETTTLTFKGSCKENIDGNAWYKDNELPNLDYVTYKNKGGIKLFAKEIEKLLIGMCKWQWWRLWC